MKNELLKDKVFRNIDEVVAAVSVAVDFYNNQRPHMSIGMLVPSEAINLCGDRNMKWKSYRLEAIKRNQQLKSLKTVYFCLSQPLTGIGSLK